MVCKSQLCHFRLVSLLEILRAYAGTYVRLTISLDQAITALQNTDIWSDPEHQDALKRTLDSFGELTIPYELPVTRYFIDRILLALGDDKHTANNALFIDYIHQLRHSLVAELGTKLFFQMPSSKAIFYDSPWQGWEEIKDRFPESATDIEEMSKCFAFSRYAGCVFHSLLVVERGLIDLGREIGVNNPKPGWDATCGLMKKLVDAGHNVYPPLSIGFSVLEQINQSAQSMKHAWRNKVNHAAGQLTVIQADFAPDVAEEIMLATRAFMRRLATDLPKSSV